MSVLTPGEQCDATGHKDCDMEDNVGLRHLLHPICGKRIDKASQNSQSGHDPNDYTRGGKIPKIRSHR